MKSRSFQLRPIHLVLRETEFCGLRLADDFRRKTRQNGRNGSQTATSRTNRPELRGFLLAWKWRRFAGTAEGIQLMVIVT